VLIAITNYGVKGVVDNNFYSHYSLLKTIEAAFDLPFIGHAKDAGTKTRAAAGACVLNKPRRRDWKTSRCWALEGIHRAMLRCKCVRFLSITAAASMQATIFTAPPRYSQVSMPCAGR
jgi:hypothetical protein